MKYIYIVLFPIFIFLMLKSSSDPVLKIFSNSIVFGQFKNGNEIVFSLSTGYIVSFIFWLMNVSIPSYQKKQDHKKSLKKYYINFKERVMEILLNSVIRSDPEYEIEFNDCDNIMNDNFYEKLLSRSTNFRKFFYRNDSENWYAVLNSLHLNDDNIKDLYIEFERLQEKFDLYINEYGNIKSIERYREFTDFVCIMKYNSNLIRPDDPSKYIGNFILEIFDDRFEFDLIKIISS